MATVKEVVRQGLDIVDEPDPTGPQGQTRLAARLGGDDVAFFTYQWNTDAAMWDLSEIQVRTTFTRYGIGTALINAFVERVGSDQPWRGSVSHPESRQAIKDNFGEPSAGQGYTIRGDGLRTIPIVRFLNAAGALVESVTVKDVSEDKDLKDPNFPYSIEAFGKTQKTP